MPMTTAGRNLLTAALVGEAISALNGTNARLGVGDSSTAFAAGQTDLQAAVNKLRKAMVSGFPTRTNNQITLRSLFGTTEANFAWNEWGVFNSASGATMVGRKVESLGTKDNTQEWQLTVTLTLTVA